MLIEFDWKAVAGICAICYRFSMQKSVDESLFFFFGYGVHAVTTMNYGLG